MTNTTNTRLPTIVYVEDNAGDALLLEEALRDRGHKTQLLVIESGEQALRYFRIKESAKDLPPPHCILLDSHLPIVTGASLLHFLRSSQVYDATPIYIFSTLDEYKLLMKDTVVSAETFLTKCDNWKGFLQLADLLMKSAAAMKNDMPANSTDSLPEAHAKGDLRAKS